MSTTPQADDLDGARRIAAVVFDVNETLFPLTPVRDRMAGVGLGPQRLEPWFRAVLVDGMAAAVTGSLVPFAELARHHLEVELAKAGLPQEDATVEGILAGFDEVVPHPDVLPALEALGAVEVEVALFTNGSARIAEGFLERAGLGDLVHHVWDVQAIGRWKPHPDAYRWVVAQLDADPDEVAMVAVHPWDVHGAVAAGLRGVWVDRDARGHYPPGLRRPHHTVVALPELVERLGLH